MIPNSEAKKVLIVKDRSDICAIQYTGVMSSNLGATNDAALIIRYTMKMNGMLSVRSSLKNSGK
jgi:hypothetical protein